MYSCRYENLPKSLFGMLAVSCDESQGLVPLTTSTFQCSSADYMDTILFGLAQPMIFRNCSMSELPLNVFANNPSTSILTLSNVGLYVLRMKDFTGAKGLQAIIARNNKLTDLPAGIFTETHVEYLNFDSNKFTKIESIGQCGADGIKTLILSNNSITTITADSFKNLTQLEKLSLSYNALGNLKVGIFEKVEKLKNLLLTSTKMTHIEFMTFARLTKLETLELSGNSFKAIDFGNHLPVFHSLNLLNVNSSQITEMQGFSQSIFPALTFLDVTKNSFNCSHLKYIISSFDLNKVKLSVDPNVENVKEGNYRGIACHPVKDDIADIVSAKFASNDNDHIKQLVNHIVSIHNEQQSTQKSHFTITIFMMMIFVCVVFGILLFVNRGYLITKIRMYENQMRPSRFTDADTISTI